MEDAATAEISRAQLWQWLHRADAPADGSPPAPVARLDDGTPIDFALFDALLGTVQERLPREGLPGQEKISEAAQLLGALTHDAELAEFLTLPAYERI
jgi:malate synthase